MFVRGKRMIARMRPPGPPYYVALTVGSSLHFTRAIVKLVE